VGDLGEKASFGSTAQGRSLIQLCGAVSAFFLSLRPLSQEKLQAYAIEVEDRQLNGIPHEYVTLILNLVVLDVPAAGAFDGVKAVLPFLEHLAYSVGLTPNGIMSEEEPDGE
jgi:hypothetical protein